MAFNPAPTEIFENWSEDGTDVTLPIASVPQMTAGEADAVTGDNRKVAFALVEQMYQWFNALALADRPTKMSIQKTVNPQGDGNTVQNVYTFSFTNVISGQDVADEI